MGIISFEESDDEEIQEARCGSRWQRTMRFLDDAVTGIETDKKESQETSNISAEVEP